LPRAELSTAAESPKSLKTLLTEKKKLTATITGKWGFDEIPTIPEFTLTFK
jgi:hypothetical protein